jgi:regulator of nucleoside diphosphate kinase
MMILTTADRDRLVSLMKAGRTASSTPDVRMGLVAAVGAATIVEPANVPPTVVTMNSVVTVIDIDTGAIAQYTLVFPSDANVDRARISVLAPLGAALLGRAEGEIIEYVVAAIVKRFYVRKVLYQPESSYRAAMPAR